MKNSADQGGPKVEVDNTLQELQNSSFPTKTEFKIIVDLIFIQNISHKGLFTIKLFSFSPKITQSCLQGFSVNGSTICSGLLF